MRDPVETARYDFRELRLEPGQAVVVELDLRG